MMASELRDLLDKVVAEHGDALLNVYIHRPARHGMAGVASASFLADQHEAYGVKVVRIDTMGASPQGRTMGATP